MNKLIFNAPFNSLSFGNVSFNLLREMYRREMDVIIFPISDQVDLSAYDLSFDKDFGQWVKMSINSRFRNVKRNIPTLKLWHIGGSESKLSDRQFLFTFYEMNRPTTEEINLLRLQDHTFFSSKYSDDIFSISGLEKDRHSVASLGFDEDFKVLDKKYYGDDVIHWGLMGKWEKRKRTSEIISLWAKKYANNKRHVLSCCVNNPFIKQEDMVQLIRGTFNEFGGNVPFNINFINRLKTNAEVNDFANSIDIDLGGLSGAEGFNLPSFNACALGKHTVVLNATAHKDWATEENSILVDIDGQLPAADGVHFGNGGPFNQGSIYTWSDESVVNAFEVAESRAKTVNEAGLKLQSEFTYAKTLDTILKQMEV